MPKQPPNCPPGLNWPPRSAEEMAAWQRRVGSDLEIARALGMARSSVYAQRVKFGVAALPPQKRKVARNKPEERRIDEDAVDRLYAGRKYEDRTSSDRRGAAQKPRKPRMLCFAHGDGRGSGAEPEPPAAAGFSGAEADGFRDPSDREDEWPLRAVMS